MEELKSLYFEIENPLDNKIKWSKILNFYSKSLNYEDFYSAVVRNKTDSNNYFNEDSKKVFSLFMWSLFKNKLLSYKDLELRNLIEKEFFDSSIYDAIKKVGDLESINTFEDLEKVLTDPIINRYFSEIFDDFTGRVIISSDFDLLSKKKLDTVISLRVDPQFLYVIVKNYVEECIKQEIPYYIRFEEKSKKIVINFYSNVEKFKLNTSIIRMIIKEHFSYVLENKDLLSANIDKHIAVRSMFNYDLTEFSKSRTSIIYKSLDSVLYDYVVNHQHILVAYKEGRMNITEYLATVVMETIINQIISDSIASKDEYYLLANSKDFVEMKDFIKNKLMLEMPQILKNRLYLKNSDEVVNFNINEEKSMEIEVEIFMSAIRNLTTILMAKDNMLEKYFRIRIKNECDYAKIDPLKFSLEQSFKNTLFFEKKKYDEYEKTLEIINSDIEKIKAYEKLIEEEQTEEDRKKIKDVYQELISNFGGEVTN